MRRNPGYIAVYIILIPAILLAVFTYIVATDTDASLPVSVLVDSKDKSREIRSWKNEKGEYYVFLPSYADMDSAKISFGTENTVYLDKKAINGELTCGDFKCDVPYELIYTAWGRRYTTTLTFMKSRNVATMYIDTESGNMEFINENKGNEEKGAAAVYMPDGTVGYSGSLESVKGRGNTTWNNFEKKPYSLRFTEAADLLGMGSAQRWILLANASDITNIRNRLAYSLADSVGMEYSPDSKWVDVYLCGEYAGLYLLCERNEVGTERIDISPDDGYVVSAEIENRLTAQMEPYITTNAKQALRIHHPSSVSNAVTQELSSVWQAVENAIMAEDGTDSETGKSYTELIDVDSWAMKYLFDEVLGNIDGGFISQFFYMDKSTDGKVYAGPVWDYDFAMGSDGVWQTTAPNGIFADREAVQEGMNAPWFSALCKKAEFKERVIELYRDVFKPQLLSALNTGIDEYMAELDGAAQLNSLRHFDESKSFEDEVERLRTYMAERMDFLDSLWIDGDKYYTVRIADNAYGNYAYRMVRPGGYVALPKPEDIWEADFDGWYLAENDRPFDPTQAINEDTQIYARWSIEGQSRTAQLAKLAPIVIIAVLGSVLLLADMRRNKRNGGRL